MHLNIFIDFLNSRHRLHFYLGATIHLLNDLLIFYIVTYRIYFFNFLEQECSLFYAFTFFYYYFAFVYLWLFVSYDVFLDWRYYNDLILYGRGVLTG